MSLPRIAGKISVITGAASGIGNALCSKFASEGANVVLVDRNQNKLQTNFNLLSDAHGSNHHHICGDVSQSGFAEQVFESVNEKYGQPADVLINCAGITRDNLLINMKEEDFDEVIKVNLKSTYVMTKAFISLLKTNGFRDASIINISSIVGKCGNVGQANYAASKAGVIGFTKTIGMEMGRFGVRCNAVLPGFIQTPMTDVVPRKQIEKMLLQIPARRMGTPEEVANACLFLASDESSYINCASLEVTGGLMP